MNYSTNHSNNSQQSDSTSTPRTLLDVLIAGALGPLMQVVETLGVTREQLCEWIEQEGNRRQIANVITLLRAQAQLVASQQQLFAVAKLAEVASGVGGGSPETVRRACNDLLRIRLFEPPKEHKRTGPGPNQPGYWPPQPDNAEEIRQEWEREGQAYWDDTDPDRDDLDDHHDPDHRDDREDRNTRNSADQDRDGRNDPDDRDDREDRNARHSADPSRDGRVDHDQANLDRDDQLDRIDHNHAADDAAVPTTHIDRACFGNLTNDGGDRRDHDCRRCDHRLNARIDSCACKITNQGGDGAGSAGTDGAGNATTNAQPAARGRAPPDRQ